METLAVTKVEGKFNPFKVGAIAGGHFFIDFYFNILPAIIPVLVLQFHLSNTALGTMVAVMAAISHFLQPVFGFLMDKKVKPFLLPLSLIWISVMMSLLGIVNNFFAIILLTTLAGIGSSVYHPLGSTMLVSVSGKMKGTAMSIYSFAGSLGLTIPPLIAIPMIKNYGMQSLLLLMIPGLLGAAFIYQQRITKIMPETVYQANEPEREEGRNEVKWVVFLNIVTALRSWSQSIVITFAPTLYMFWGHSETEAGRLLSIFFLTGTIGVLAGGYLSDHLSRKNLLVYTSVISITFYYLFFITEGWISVVMFAIASAAVQSSNPVTIVIAQRLLPKNTGLASGMMMGMTFGIGSIGALFTGVMGDLYGLEFAVKSLLWILVLSAVFAFHLPKKIIDR